MLFYCCRQWKTKKSKSLLWTNDHIADIKSSKKNICTSKTSHFGSKGYYASFGLRENYKVVDRSSLALYSVVKKSDDKLQTIVKEKTKKIEELIAAQLAVSTESFGKYLPHITDLLSPIINEAYHSQSDWGDIGLVNCATKDSGLWQSQICIDASTSEVHTEND